MDKRPIYIGLFLILGIIIALALSLYYSNAKQVNTKAGEKKESLLPSVIPSPTKPDDSSWKIFNNSTFQYQYPSSWITNQDQLYSYNPDLIPSEEIGLPVPKDKLKVDFVSFQYDGTPLAKWLLTTEQIYHSPDQKISEEKDMSVGGRKAISRIECSEMGCVKAIYIALEKNVLGMFVYPADSKEMETLDKILTTFKFSDSDNIEGRFCGGIAANRPENICPEDYICKIEANHPDAGGICVKSPLKEATGQSELLQDRK
ncbi:hypothetical protein AUJ73_00760 [Candidatus Gottesmanbacteria bacterium CG1_02_37_22]|uniref:Uncharacterized protein n=1 Tax=Candidatus Gottesmanbacteria bacterium CG1_02_37_22 TaxID=1805209 RepID=A0A1J4TWJ0_9BACT|nr:MAG: hypothetical protein AUJ73_00760 [Candidatus Gottesmanbacteria bacterium CG1_02_37_22]